MNKWPALLLIFIFCSCAYFTKDSSKECEDIIKENRAFRKDCFEFVDEQDRQIGKLKQENDSLLVELEKCR